MADAADNDAIVVTGSRAPREWGYNIDITDRISGEVERRWIDDRRERVNLERDNQTIVETNVADGATLTLNGDSDRGNVIMPRVNADSQTTVNVNTGRDNDVIAPTTLQADRPRAADAQRPQFNINGGAGDDTVYVSAPSNNVIIQRTGPDSYRVTDGTGTDINLTDVEYLNGREQDRPSNLTEPARIEVVNGTTYRMTDQTGRSTDFDMRGQIDGPLPALTTERGPSSLPSADLPRGDSRVNLEQLDLQVGEGMTLEQAQRPRTEHSGPMREALFRAQQNGLLPENALEGLRLPWSETQPERLSNLDVQTQRAQIEQTRGQESQAR